MNCCCFCTGDHFCGHHVNAQCLFLGIQTFLSIVFIFQILSTFIFFFFSSFFDFVINNTLLLKNKLLLFILKVPIPHFSLHTSILLINKYVFIDEKKRTFFCSLFFISFFPYIFLYDIINKIYFVYYVIFQFYCIAHVSIYTLKSEQIR